MSITDFLSNLFSSISFKLSGTPDSVKEMKAKKKATDKSNKEFRKKQYQQLFADCSIHELRLMDEIIKNNNAFVEFDSDYIESSKELYHKGVREDVFQIDDIDEDGYRDDEKIRINPILYPKMAKEFKKYGQPRIKK